MTYHVTGTNTYTGGGATVAGAGQSGNQLGTHLQQGTVYAGNSNALGANAASNPISIYRATGNVNSMHAGLLLDFAVDGSLFNRQPINVRPPNSTVSALTLGGSQPVQSVFHNAVVITNAFGAGPANPAAGVALLLHQAAGGRVTFTNSLLSAGWATNAMRVPVFEKTGPGEVLLQSPGSTLSATPVVRNGTLLLGATAGTNTGASVLGNATATNLAAFGLGTKVHLGGARSASGLGNVRLVTVGDLATNVYNPVGGASGIGQYTNVPNSSLALDNTTLVAGDRVLVLLAGNSQHNSLAPANGVYLVSATNGTAVNLDRTADPVVPGTWVTANAIAGKVHSGRTFYLANQTTNFVNGGVNGTVQLWLPDESDNLTPTLNPALVVNAAVTFARDLVVNASPAIQSATLGGSTAGMVAFTGGVQLARDLVVTSAGTGTNSVVFRGVLGGIGSVAKAGTGAVTFAAVNTYSGLTWVNQGALWADAGGGSATGTGAVIVASGATLGGTGWVSGPVTNQGTVAPGRAGIAGTLSVSQSVTLAAGSVYDWDAAGGVRDRLNAATASCTGPWTLRVNAAGLTNGTYVLLSTTGGVTAFTAPTILGATGVVSVVGNDVVLVIPGLTPFQQWQMAQFGTTNGAAQWDGDPDGDGLLNLGEYAMGLNPRAGDIAQGPALGDDGAYLTLTVPRNAEARDVTYHFQATSNLTDWTTVSSCTATNPAPAGTPVVFTNVVPMSASPAQFMRVQISSP
jgi:autotransporter-associated beta strand protein